MNLNKITHQESSGGLKTKIPDSRSSTKSYLSSLQVEGVASSIYIYIEVIRSGLNKKSYKFFPYDIFQIMSDV